MCVCERMAFNQVCQVRRGGEITTPGPDLHPGQNCFLNPAGNRTVDISNHLLDRNTAAAPARQARNAVSAVIITAILDLDESPRAFSVACNRNAADRF